MASRAAIPTDGASVISRERITEFLRAQYNALSSLTPQQLKAQHAAWDSGYLRAFALTQNQIVERDDILRGVEGKRIKAASIRGYDILTVEDSKRADQHREALVAFYDNLVFVNAVDENERGGVSSLFRSQMRAVGFKYSVQEIVWKPSRSMLTAEIREVPLWFFENTTGRLRFLRTNHSTYGENLEPGRWLITVGEHLMKACSIAYLYKHAPLRDWLIYSGRHGMPGVAGKTDAAFGSPEWRALERAVASFASEFAAVMSNGDTIEPIDLSSSGELPYPKLVERMDRVMSALWRGADLSTISSSGDSVGATLQGEEKEVLEASDAAMMSEALNTYVDRFVIRHYFGDPLPLAYIQVKTATRRSIDQDLKVDEQLWRMGYPISLQTLSETYNRPLADGSPEYLTPPSAQPGESTAGGRPFASNTALSAANEIKELPDDLGKFLAGVRMEFPEAVSGDLAPLAGRLIELLRAADEEDLDDVEFRARLITFRDVELPGLAKTIFENQTSGETLRQIMNAAFVLGIEQETETRA